MQAHRVPSARRTRIGMAFILIGMILGVGGLMPSPAHADPQDKVSICHRTNSVSNPYVFISVNASAVDGEGKNDHTHHLGPIFDFSGNTAYDPPHSDDEWGDIIPGGLNWEGGQAIWDNGCQDTESECEVNCEPVECEEAPGVDEQIPDCPTDTCLENPNQPNCPQPRCEDTNTCPNTDPCPNGGELIGDQCYTPCPEGQTRVNDQCVPPGEVASETITCPAPNTLVNGVCTPPAEPKPVEVQGVVLTQAPAAAPELPRTGKETAALVALGMALTVAGGLLVASQKLLGDRS